MARQAKGINVAQFVKTLKSWKKHGGHETVPGLVPEYAGYLRHQRILSSQWYPLELFLHFLDLTHRHVFGGTDKGLIDLGRFGAASNSESAHAVYLKSEPTSMLQVFPRLWSANFNFGELVIEHEQASKTAVVTFADYEDIPRSHALVHLGWFEVLLTKAGAENARCTVAAEPWNGDPLFAVRLSWKSLG